MLEKLNSFTFNHSDQQDDLYTSLTPAEIKQAFDSRGVQLKDHVNGIIDLLNRITDSIEKGGSGADQISLTAIAPFAGTKLQTFLEQLVQRLNSSSPTSSGASMIGAPILTNFGGSSVASQLGSIASALYTAMQDIQTLKSTSTSNVNRLNAAESSINALLTRLNNLDTLTASLVTKDQTHDADIAGLKTTTTNLQNNKADKTEVQIVQNQLNQTVIQGDSSVEAAQARVKADGTSFTTLRDRLNSTDADLAERTTPKKFDLADSKGKGLDIVDVIQEKISQGYNWFVVPKRTRLNKTLQLLNVYNIVFEGVGGFEPEFELNTGGVGIKVEGSSFIMFKNMTIGTRVVSSHFDPINLTTPSTIGIMYTRSLQEDSCQWNNSDNLTIYMHTDAAANGGKGTIGLYNCTAESQSYNNLTVYADVPVVVTRTDIYNLAIKRSPSMKAVHFAGAATFIATGGHALVLEGVSDVTFDNLYMAKDIFYGSNTQQYACLITGASSQGYENYNLVFLNYDCEEFESGFKVISRLRHSKIFGNQHSANATRIISVETAEAILDTCEIDIQSLSSQAAVDLAYFDSLCAGAVNTKFVFYKETYRLTCNKPLLGCTVYAKSKPNIVNNHGGHQTVNVFSEVGIGINNNYINFAYNKPASTDGSPFVRGNFPGNFAFNTNTQVGSPAGWISNGSDFFEVGQVGSRQFDHNPTNVETPVRLGEEVFDWMGQKWYKSVGLNKTDWRAMTV